MLTNSHYIGPNATVETSVVSQYWLPGVTSLLTTTSPRGSCPLSLSWTPTTAQSTTRGCLSSTCSRDWSCS